ncbi:MAG TPA: hypothetical protein VFJ65_09340 [Solirubrobacterales bacterium]|nr:hypothetical protein [Solirubrobacterales bacterium]
MFLIQVFLFGRFRSDRSGAVGEEEQVSSVGVGSINEILVQDATGAWKEIVVSRLSSAEGGF